MTAITTLRSSFSSRCSRQCASGYVRPRCCPRIQRQRFAHLRRWLCAHLRDACAAGAFVGESGTDQHAFARSWRSESRSSAACTMTPAGQDFGATKRGCRLGSLPVRRSTAAERANQEACAQGATSAEYKYMPHETTYMAEQIVWIAISSDHDRQGKVSELKMGCTLTDGPCTATSVWRWSEQRRGTGLDGSCSRYPGKEFRPDRTGMCEASPGEGTDGSWRPQFGSAKADPGGCRYLSAGALGVLQSRCRG